MRPRISVVIPTNGRWPLVRDCLRMLARQSRLPDEVLLVCDGLRLAPPGDLAEELGILLRIVTRERGGVALARNTGIAQADGDIVAFTDDDALVSQGWLAALEDCFLDPGVAGVGGPVLPRWQIPPPAWIDVSRRARGCLGLLDLGPSRRQIDPEVDFLIGSNCAYRKSFILMQNGFRGVVACPGVGVCGEDFELSRRIARAQTVLYEPAAVVHHLIPAERLRWRPILQRAFYYEAVRARLGGRLKPKRSLPDLLRRELFVSVSVVFGYFYGRLLRRRDRTTPSAGPLRKLAGTLQRRFFSLSDGSEPVPRFFKLEMAPRCNLRCVHCEQWHNIRDPEDLPLERWLGLVSEIARWAAPCHLNISCGEPMLEPGVFPVIAAAQRQGLTVTLVTNGTIIDGKCAVRLRESGLRNLLVSLDGVRPETHDLSRGVAGTHGRVLMALNHLDVEGLSARVQIQTIIAGHNLEELRDLVRFAQARGLAGIRFQALLARGAHWREIWPEDPEAAVRAIDGLLRMKAAGSPILNPATQLETMKSYFRQPNASFQELACRSAETLAVGRKGDAYLCRFMEPVGDIRRVSIRDAWRASAVGRRRSQVRACHEACILLNCHYQAP
ncbi:MAG: radical SAM protein [Elusimicrobiota bacterium]